MSDHSHHHHDHSLEMKDVNSAFIIGMVLNFAFVIIEAGYGWYVSSLSLIADAGHNLTDVVSLGLSLLAFKLVQVKPTKNYTYGYKKTSILIALFNSVILLVTIGIIIYEAVTRFFHHEILPGKTIAIVAGIGIVINSFTAWLFLKNKERDINIKSAYLHLLADALVSLAIVIGGVVIIYTNWYWVDSVLSLIVGGVIFFSTWNLLKQSLRLSLDGVPDGVDVEKLRSDALKTDGVFDVHHIHVWAMSSTENALTAHIVLKDDFDPANEAKLKHELRHLFQHQNIQHVTLETEHQSFACNETQCAVSEHQH